MTIDLDKYRNQIPFIKYLMDKAKPEERLTRTLSEIAPAIHCPIIAVAYYVAEIYGMSPETQLVIDKLKTYYRVTEVKGVREYETI